MPDQHRDDSPTAFSLAPLSSGPLSLGPFSLGRREVVIGGAFLVGGLAAGLLPPSTLAQAAWSDEASARFMDISSLLIPHRLNQDVGKRIGAAMSMLNPALSEQVAQLLAIAKNKNAKIVEDFFPDVPEGPLKETALAIISAWYLSVVKDADEAEVFAFEYALMYQPTRDVMTIPSYAISGPNAWPADAPPLENMPDF
jgi:fructose 5-dehydrogenase small subunit